MPNKFSQTLNRIMQVMSNTRDDTDRFSPSDIEQNRMMALLSYIWLCCLVPMFAAKNSPYALYHARQGLILAIVETAAALVLGLLAKIPLLGIIFAIARFLLLFTCVVLSLVGIYNVLNNKARELPLMGLLTQYISKR
jgi:uncharacterized membrane protein